VFTIDAAVYLAHTIVLRRSADAMRDVLCRQAAAGRRRLHEREVVRVMVLQAERRRRTFHGQAAHIAASPLTWNLPSRPARWQPARHGCVEGKRFDRHHRRFGLRGDSSNARRSLAMQGGVECQLSALSSVDVADIPAGEAAERAGRQQLRRLGVMTVYLRGLSR